MIKLEGEHQHNLLIWYHVAPFKSPPAITKIDFSALDQVGTSLSLTTLAPRAGTISSVGTVSKKLKQSATTQSLNQHVGGTLGGTVRSQHNPIFQATDQPALVNKQNKSPFGSYNVISDNSHGSGPFESISRGQAPTAGMSFRSPSINSMSSMSSNLTTNTTKGTVSSRNVTPGFIPAVREQTSGVNMQQQGQPPPPSQPILPPALASMFSLNNQTIVPQPMSMLNFYPLIQPGHPSLMSSMEPQGIHARATALPLFQASSGT